MAQKKPKRIFGMTYLQISVLAGSAILLIIIGCLAITLVFSNQITKTTPSIPPTKPIIATNSTPTILPQNISSPEHQISDYWDNGKGTNFAYFIFADKSTTERGAQAIIQKYQNKHKGYKLINIYIFCDNFYADFKNWDTMDYSGGVGDEIFKDVMYWSMSGEWASSGGHFITGPSNDYPTFGMDCQ